VPRTLQGHNIDPEEIVGTRIFPDMHPFRFQIQSLAFHSLGAINAIKNGARNLPADNPPDDYASLQGLIAATRGAGKVLSAEGFLMSFSLPNFYYHYYRLQHPTLQAYLSTDSTISESCVSEPEAERRLSPR
jgi:hypothetical protein